MTTITAPFGQMVTAMITPMTPDGAVDYDGAARLADYLVTDMRNDGLVINGTITRNAWGEIWTRPGLPRHTRSLLTLAMMVALNRGDEFRMHVRGAFNNGVTRDEIKEVLLQSAVYCGVPAANTAFHIAAEVFSEMHKKTKPSSSKRKRQ